MINNLLRYCLSLLSFFYKNNLNKLKSHHNLISSEIINKLKKFSFTKSSRLKTHKIFSKTVYELILQNKTLNFLRNIKVQNIFFIHNRLFIFKELKEIQKDKIMWSLWKKLLIENDIGDPVRYFLYPKSSGNRIRQVYHLKKYYDFSKINLPTIKYILEIGGGYGCMAQIFKKINNKCTYVIYDTVEVNFLQYYYIKMNKIPVVLNKVETGKVCLISDLNLIKKFNNQINNTKFALFIANWSISEMPRKLRERILLNINNFSNQIISFQEQFENINNKKYFYNYKKKVENKYLISIQKFKFYKKNFLNKNNHFYFFSKNHD